MSSRLLRREYTGKLPLPITDHALRKRLLSTFNASNEFSTVKYVFYQNKQFLLELGNVLSATECVEIIANTDAAVLEDVSDTYRFGKQRKSERLLALDEKLAEGIWERICDILQEKLKEYNVMTRPLGFDVRRGDWDLYGLNEAMRVNKYCSETKGFFGPHKDAQYCPSGDERSIFTLLIYLNEDFTGGSTCFYIPKDPSLPTKDMTIKEEIKLHGGLNVGYECIKVTPKVGHAVISSQNYLHEALPVNKGSKYILKTDIVLRRTNKQFGFSIGEDEKHDYSKCVNYFREAQQKENDLKFDIASDLYEKALSIRYSYPSSNHAEIQVIDTSGYLRMPLEVWLLVFHYLSGYDIQNLVYAYPQLNITKAVFEQQRRNLAPRLVNENFIPKLRFQSGVISSFIFPHAKFFEDNYINCCRVVAMYSFYLLGHSPSNDYYTVEYNPLTQEVCVVALETLLSDVFYGRRCYGSVYNVRQQDPKKRDPRKDFEASVDRSYMLAVHANEFIGMELADHFNIKSAVHITADAVDNEEEDDESDHSGDDEKSDHSEKNECDSGDNDEEDEEHCDVYKSLKLGEPATRKVGIYHDNILPFYWEVDRNYSLRDTLRCLLRDGDQIRERFEIETDPYEELNCPEKMEDYFKSVEKVSCLPGASAAVVVELKSLMNVEDNEICICFLGPNYEFSENFTQQCPTKHFNYLVFDFEKALLSVVEEGFVVVEDVSGSSTVEDVVLTDMKEMCGLGDGIKATVNIEPLLSAATSFNHASCQCGHPRFELKQFHDLKRYHHLTSVTIWAKEKDGEMYVWSAYNGVVAM